MGCKPSKEATKSVDDDGGLADTPLGPVSVPVEDGPAAVAVDEAPSGSNEPELLYPLASSQEDLQAPITATPVEESAAEPAAGDAGTDAIADTDADADMERAVQHGELSRATAASLRLPPAVAPKPQVSPKATRYMSNPEEPDSEESAVDRAKRMHAQSLAMAFKQSIKGKPLSAEDAAPASDDEDGDDARPAVDDHDAAHAQEGGDAIIKVKPKKAMPMRGGLAAMSMKIAQEAQMRHVRPLADAAPAAATAGSDDANARAVTSPAANELPQAVALTAAEAQKTLASVWARIDKQILPDGVQPIKGDPTRKGWRVVRVFVSSTFADYFSERELLVKHVFPELRAWCQERRLFLVEVDLRWGVPKDSPTETTLRACLGELDRCRADNVHPFFLNMLGDRYGWTPSTAGLPAALSKEYDWVAGVSVTHMEILHGAFREKNPNALFFIRNSAVSAAVPDEFRGSFLDAEPYAAQALSELKARVRARFAKQTVDYTATVDGVDTSSGTRKPRLSGLDTLKKKTLEFFQAAIERQYPLSSEPLTRVEELAIEHDDIVAHTSGQVFGRDTEVAALLQFAEEGIRAPKVSRPPLIITTNAGMGKTCFAAAVCQAARLRRMQVVFHSTGVSAEATDFTVLLERLGLELASPAYAALVSEKGGAGWNLATVTAMLETPTNIRSSGLPVIVLIDGVDGLSDGGGAASALSLPALYPGRVSVVFTVDSGNTNDKLREVQPSPKNFDLPTLPKRWLSRIVEAHFEKFNKKLDQQQLDLLFANTGSRNLRWLHIVCEELRMHGAFETVSELITSFGDTVPKLLTQVLARIKRDDPSGVAASALAFIAASYSGLSETELCSLIGRLREADGGSSCTVAEWAVIHGQISNFTRPIGVGRLTLVERDVEQVVVAEVDRDGDRKMSEKCTLRLYRRCLADYFETVTDTQRKNSEYPMQLMQLNDKTRLLAFARSSNFHTLHFSARYAVIRKLQCSMVVPNAPEPPGEVLCTPCGSKSTIHAPFMNKMVCCMCGGMTFSGAHLQPGAAVTLIAGDKVAVKCQRHRALGVAMHKKCLLCAAVVDPRFALPALVCRHCASPHTLSCCFMG